MDWVSDCVVLAELKPWQLPRFTQHHRRRFSSAYHWVLQVSKCEKVKVLGLCLALLMLKGRSWVFKEQKNNLWWKSEDNREPPIDRCIICCIQMFSTQNSDIMGEWWFLGEKIVSLSAAWDHTAGVWNRKDCVRAGTDFIFFLTADEHFDSWPLLWGMCLHRNTNTFPLINS